MRTGYYTFPGAASVDPAVIPHGSIFFIVGDPRLRVALDTGGGVKGAWVDLWVASDEEGRELMRAYGTGNEKGETWTEIFVVQEP